MSNKYPQLYIMRYMGSKLKLLDFIIPKLKQLVSPGEAVLDLMAGTHAIGYALKPEHPIIANDIQEYSKIIGVARIENNSIHIGQDDIDADILSKIKSNKSHHLFTKHYSDTYFSADQCKEIDDIRYAIDLIDNKLKQTLYLTALVYAMGYCQSSPGHFAQYMPKNHPRLKKLRKLSITKAFVDKCIENHIIFSSFKNKVLSEDYRDLLSEKNRNRYLKGVKLIYVDPPYSAAQYSRFYHLLETAVKYDYPEINYKGLYRGDRFQSDFCYPTKVRDEFDFIARNASDMGSALAISYSDRGLISSNEIKKICRKYYRDVDIHSKSYSHSMQGRGVLQDLHEVLITCQ